MNVLPIKISSVVNTIRFGVSMLKLAQREVINGVIPLGETS